MRRTVIATATATALLAATISSAVAYKENGNGYGLGVKVHCGAPYGQLVQQAQPGHPIIGAKAFITNIELATLHGCFAP